MLPEQGADEMEIGGEIYNFNFPVNGIALSPNKTQVHYSAIGKSTFADALMYFYLISHIASVICMVYFSWIQPVSVSHRDSSTARDC